MESRLQRGRNLTKIDAVKLIKRNMDLVLSFNYGKGFTKSYLYNFVRFYKTFPNIFPTLSGQSKLL